jgi:hypothetical protein
MRSRREKKPIHDKIGKVQVAIQLPRPIHKALQQRLGDDSEMRMQQEIVPIVIGEHPPVHISDDFFAPVSLDRLAEEQGVKPVTDVAELLGNFWPEDESADDVIQTVRAWRDEEPGCAA